MEQKTPKKLELKKKTVTRLNNDQLSQMEGGSVLIGTAICASAICATRYCVTMACVTMGCATLGCATDITRVGH